MTERRECVVRLVLLRATVPTCVLANYLRTSAVSYMGLNISIASPWMSSPWPFFVKYGPSTSVLDPVDSRS